MNPRRLVLAILVAFITVFLTDFLIHAIWMAPGLQSHGEPLAPGRCI